MAENKRTTGPFTLRDDRDLDKALEDYTHIYHGGARCSTDTIGHATPDDMSLQDLVLHAPQGFIPLWAEGVTLRWRFQERSVQQFVDPDAAKDYVRDLLADAALAWGAAVPVRFAESHQPWDFEIKLSARDDCDPRGCTLASAFFPDAGQHELELFPLMFRNDRDEQIETMAHELGHVFGLRHFFAQTREAIVPSVEFGTQDPNSIMNYGPQSELTDTDISDLIALYSRVWSGDLTHVNGTPIHLVEPYSATNARALPPALVARSQSYAARTKSA
ncbi:hypothetical protein ROLI_033500 [Roseobacter fucihabitans]|uniref:Peptidase metallopeptidase domain-containing protein n=1 Tax=Roseobacter fucihabitans TaxID=1537242 RepID=A0ABZ2BW88_9RHOB|nr:matrixin family metalloprotease [Roseobacter litoralis]MBC6966768.1 Matrixin [Roseobacter litoralis]